MTAEHIRNIINLLESIVDETVDKIEVKHRDGPDTPFDSGTAFGATDRHLLQNAEHLARIEKALSRVDHKFEIYFVNHNKFDADHKKLKYGEKEEDADSDDLAHLVRVGTRIQDRKSDLNYGIYNSYKDIDPAPGKIVVIILGNISTYHQPMTPWIVAHKIAHAWCDYEGYDGSNIPYQFKRYYDQFKYLITNETDRVYPMRVKKTLFKKEERRSHNLLSTKSGRLNQNYHNLDDEALVEMVTQYLITGKITFNLTDVPEKYHVGMRRVENTANKLLRQVFNDMAGHIIVTA
jgi:hypothetical protein